MNETTWQNCAVCLRKLGFGKGRMARILRRGHDTLGAFLNGPARHVERPLTPGFSRKRPRKPKPRFQNPTVECALCLHRIGLGYDRISNQMFGSRKRRHKVATWVQWHFPNPANQALDAYRKAHPKPKPLRLPAADRVRRSLVDYEARYKTRSHHQLAKGFTAQLWNALKHKRCIPRVEAMVGCCYQHLLNHLSSQFHSGMSFDNYGTVWCVDHRVPQCAYDLRIQSERKLCHYYPNLQPMLRPSHAKKGITTHLPVFLHPYDHRVNPAKLRFPRLPLGKSAGPT